MTKPFNPLPIQRVEREGGAPPDAPFFPPLDGKSAPAKEAPAFSSFLPADAPREQGDDAPPVEATELQPPSETEIRVMQLEKMLQEAKAHAERLENDAYNEAFAKGEKAGIALAKERADATLDQFDQMLRQARQQMVHIQRATADAIIDIAQMITETLIGELRHDQREWLVHAAAKVSEMLPATGSPLQLAVNPDDLAEIKAIAGGESRDWQIVADPTLEGGSCRLISPQQDAFIDPLHAVAELVRTIRPELQASIHATDA